jgi:putative tributyrin esterase
MILRPRPRVLLLAAALLAVAATARAAGPTLKSVAFDAPSVGRIMTYRVALPADYESANDKRYPVLYLLHGLTSNYTAWAKLGAAKAAEGLDLIVVMPDAGNSWYANWAQSDDGQKNAWDDYIVKDLIGHVDSTYRTVAAREGRAINGLSMGGYGGLMLGLRHPEMFCSIGSHSGAIAFAHSVGDRLRSGQPLPPRKDQISNTPNPDIIIEGFRSPAERTPKGKLVLKPEDADAIDPFKLVLAVPKDKLPHIYIDCGTEDRLIKSNRDFVKLLTENNIPFTYGESPGGHVPAYWAREIHTSVPLQYAILRRNLAMNKDEPKEKPKSEEKPKDAPKELKEVAKAATP